MDNKIKAIETHYKGYRFRSRLEARWAVFFDAAGIEYQYEPEGIEYCGERYLPDFYLPNETNYGCYVEVKPDDSARREEIKRAARVVCMGAGKPLVTLADIPYITDCGMWCYPMFGFDQIGGEIYGALVPLVFSDEGPYFSQGLYLSHITRKTSYFILTHHAWNYSFAGISCKDLELKIHGDKEDEPMFWQTESDEFLETAKNCYIAARSARFEFGEKG